MNSLIDWLSRHINGTMLVTGLIVTIAGGFVVKKLFDSKTIAQKNIKANGDIVAGDKTTNIKAGRDIIGRDKTESS